MISRGFHDAEGAAEIIEKMYLLFSVGRMYGGAAGRKSLLSQFHSFDPTVPTVYITQEGRYEVYNSVLQGSPN